MARIAHALARQGAGAAALVHGAHGVGKLEVARHKARRVGIGDVAGNGALALGTQQQRVAVKVQSLGQLVEHGGLQSLWFGACGATARGLLWRASIMEIAPLF
jgi:hypothetical protein